MIPLSEGTLLGEIAEPEVEGRVYKTPNGRVTVYGRLTGSEIAVKNQRVLSKVVNGSL